MSTQKFAAIHPIIRVNATELIVFRLRNYQDTAMFVDELGGLVDKKTLSEIYKTATEQPYSFLYVRLNAKKLEDTFMINFNQKIKITHE